MMKPVWRFLLIRARLLHYYKNAHSLITIINYNYLKTIENLELAISVEKTLVVAKKRTRLTQVVCTK